MILLFNIKTRTLGFAFCQPQKSPYQNLSPKQSHYKISTPKKSSDHKFQTQKRASHIPVTYIPEYPPGPAGLSLYILPQKYKSGPNNWRQKSANPTLCPHMSPGSTPPPGWPLISALISELTYSRRNLSGLLA